jgi:hypothetical protein
MGIWNWTFGKHEPRPPDPERSCEAAWLPLWQAQMVLHELLERDIPAVVAEDFRGSDRGHHGLPARPPRSLIARLRCA